MCIRDSAQSYESSEYQNYRNECAHIFHRSHLLFTQGVTLRLHMRWSGRNGRRARENYRKLTAIPDSGPSPSPPSPACQSETADKTGAVEVKSDWDRKSSLSPFPIPVSYTHLRAHETPEHLVC